MVKINSINKNINKIMYKGKNKPIIYISLLSYVIKA